MTASPVHRDERTVLVENASFRWAYLFMSFGALGIVAYRSLVWRESPWDLMLLVVLGGGVPVAYQGYHRVLSSRWAIKALAAVILGALVAAATVLVR